MACTLIAENLRGHLRQAVPCKGLKQIVLVPPPRLGCADGGGFGNEVAPVHATRAHFLPSAPHRRPYARCDARHHGRLFARSGDVFGAGRHDFSRESKRDRGPFTRIFFGQTKWSKSVSTGLTKSVMSFNSTQIVKSQLFLRDLSTFDEPLRSRLIKMMRRIRVGQS